MFDLKTLVIIFIHEFSSHGCIKLDTFPSLLSTASYNVVCCPWMRRRREWEEGAEWRWEEENEKKKGRRRWEKKYLFNWKKSNFSHGWRWEKKYLFNWKKSDSQSQIYKMNEKWHWQWREWWEESHPHIFTIYKIVSKLVEWTTLSLFYIQF